MFDAEFQSGNISEALRISGVSNARATLCGMLCREKYISSIGSYKNEFKITF